MTHAHDSVTADRHGTVGDQWATGSVNQRDTLDQEIGRDPPVAAPPGREDIARDGQPSERRGTDPITAPDR